VTVAWVDEFKWNNRRILVFELASKLNIFIYLLHLFQKSTYGRTTFGYRTGHITTYKICHT
jgi:hypothetical protein